MNNNPTSNIVSALKQKMTDTREETLRYKDKIQEMESRFQVSKAKANKTFLFLLNTTHMLLLQSHVCYTRL